MLSASVLGAEALQTGAAPAFVGGGARCHEEYRARAGMIKEAGFPLGSWSGNAPHPEMAFKMRSEGSPGAGQVMVWAKGWEVENTRWEEGHTCVEVLSPKGKSPWL